MRTCILSFMFLIHALDSASCETVETFQISREEFDRLQNTVDDLRRFAKDQIAINQQLQADCQQLQAENQHLKSEIKQLQQRTNIQELQTILTEQEGPMNLFKEKAGGPKEVSTSPRTQKEKRRSSSVPNRVQRKRNVESPVAFFATMTQAYEDHLGMHQNIIFEDVVTNFGNAYNNHHGVFVAPVSGLYLITTSVLSRQDGEYFAAITVNGTEIVRLNGRGSDGRHGTGAQTLIMALKRGDDVSIQNIRADINFWGDKFSSFGGVLLQEFDMQSSSIIG